MKKIIAMLLAVVMVFALCACGTSNEPAATPAGDAAPAEESSTPAEKIPLKISHHPYMHGLPTTYAIENGLYDVFDYTVDYYAGGPVQNEAIASGAWEVGTTGVAGAVLGITGYNMKVIGISQDEAAVTDAWCRSDSALASAERDELGVLGTAEDWKGLDVLIATGTNTHMTLIATLEHLGLTENDVNIIDCSSVPNVYTAFMAGEGDVAFIWAPYGYTLQSDENYTKVCDIGMFGIALPTLVVCTEEAYNTRPEVVKQWLDIYYESCEALMADTALGAEMLYNFSEDQGIVMSEEAAADEFVYRPFVEFTEVQAAFKENADGGSEIYDILMNYAQFMLSQGKISQEQYDAMAASDFVVDLVN